VVLAETTRNGSTTVVRVPDRFAGADPAREPVDLEDLVLAYLTRAANGASALSPKVAA
jgi:hypothetical protein